MKINTYLLTCFYLCIALRSQANLVVYTYDSFNSDWGPGPQIEKAFENICDCDLKFVTVGMVQLC